MDATRTITTDAVALVQQLDPDAIRRRLDELDAEASALRVLYRSARARQSAARRRPPVAEPEGVRNDR
jgi:hypothetical protein